MSEFLLPSGESVQLRGLSGYEVLLSRKKYRDDEIALNAFTLACAMDVTEGAALEWLKEHSAGDFVAATDEVQRRSGLGDDSNMEASKSPG